MSHQLSYTPNKCVNFTRTQIFQNQLTYSVLNFLVLLGRVYILLLFLSMVNHGSLEKDVIQRWVRVQLGRVDRWPWWSQLLLILVVAVASWFVVTPLLRHLSITPAEHTHARTAVEGLVLGIASILVCKYLIIAVLVLYFANTYIYFGRSPLWEFVQVTGQNLLWPIRFIPLLFGRLDIRPLIMVGLVTAAAYGCEIGLERIYLFLPRWV